MVIKDLFSHKIHSSRDSWSNKLIDLAFIFSEFDRTPYDRKKLEKRLGQISPRASTVARDPSKFRDEISAYPAYLGLYRVELIDGIWHFVLSETAKKFLITEEPNVPAFMLLQLTLFQYPNGMGVAYSSNSHGVRIQANTRDRTLDFINNEIHLSPLRLICKAIQAHEIAESKSIFDVTISYDEIFSLANDPRINKFASPPLDNISEAISDFNKGNIKPPKPYESRFHILKHTDFLIPEKSGIRLRSPLSKIDENELLDKFKVINSINSSFLSFDQASRSDDILESIIDGAWGRYFDGVRSLNSEFVEILSSEKGIFEQSATANLDLKPRAKEPADKLQAPMTYSFRKRNQDGELYSNYSIPKTKTDPELTRIRRQKSNLTHKLILQRLEEYLESKGCDPVENDHIDLFAEISGSDKFLFEVKSTSDSNLLSQTRKGVSQLYEYRYRYQNELGYDVKLCLVYPKKPNQIDWLEDYICKDREIGIIWFEESGELNYPIQAKHLVESLI